MSEKSAPRNRFWVEVALASATAILALVTAVWHEWIEFVFGVDPDAGSGALEWGIVVAFASVTVLVGCLAGAEWRYATAAASDR